jgi:hypothetical protein
MARKDLQQLAKSLGVKANLKNTDMITAILEAQAPASKAPATAKEVRPREEPMSAARSA